jgi:hypothetical protein
MDASDYLGDFLGRAPLGMSSIMNSGNNLHHLYLKARVRHHYDVVTTCLRKHLHGVQVGADSEGTPNGTGEITGKLRNINGVL